MLQFHRLTITVWLRTFAYIQKIKVLLSKTYFRTLDLEKILSQPVLSTVGRRPSLVYDFYLCVQHGERDDTARRAGVTAVAETWSNTML